MQYAGCNNLKSVTETVFKLYKLPTNCSFVETPCNNAILRIQTGPPALLPDLSTQLGYEEDNTIPMTINMSANSYDGIINIDSDQCFFLTNQLGWFFEDISYLIVPLFIAIFTLGLSVVGICGFRDYECKYITFFLPISMFACSWVLIGLIGFNMCSPYTQVMTHEIGHFMNLAHTPVSSAIMYYLLQLDVTQACLMSDDMNGLTNLYLNGGNFSGKYCIDLEIESGVLEITLFSFLFFIVGFLIVCLFIYLKWIQLVKDEILNGLFAKCNKYRHKNDLPETQLVSVAIKPTIPITVIEGDENV